jgi:hypothetical protein
MKSHTVKTIGAAKTAGHRKNNEKLCDAWIAYKADPRDETTREVLALEVSAAIKREYPRFRGPWLQHNEDDVRSHAATLLMDAYLVGNRRLLQATGAGDRRRIGEELSRSLRGAVSTAKRETLKPIRGHKKLIKKLEEASAGTEASEPHPSQYRSLRDLPAASQQQLLLDIVDRGLESAAINREVAELAGKIIDEGLTPAEAGRTLGMTRRKTHARMKRLRGYLNRSIEHAEFPMM